MKVKELKQILNSLSDDTIIVMSSDSEGNDFSPLSSHSVGKYVADNTWAGTFYSDLDFEDAVNEAYFDEEEGVKAVCIWPTN